MDLTSELVGNGLLVSGQLYLDNELAVHQEDVVQRVVQERDRGRLYE